MSRLAKVRTGALMAPPVVIVYGDPGLGKTSFAAEFPRVILQPCEPRAGDNTAAAKLPLAESWDDVKGGLRELIDEPHDFKSYALDSLDWLEKLIHKQVCADKFVSSLEEIDYGKGYHFAAAYWQEFTGLLDELIQKRRMAVCLVAHSKLARVDPPDAQSYQQYDLDLHTKTAAPHMFEWAEYVIFITQRKFVSTQEVGFNKEVSKVGTTGERVLMTTANPAYKAKTRVPMPAEVLYTPGKGYTAIIGQIKAHYDKLAPKEVKVEEPAT